MYVASSKTPLSQKVAALEPPNKGTLKSTLTLNKSD